MQDNIPEKELTREDLEREFAKRKDLQRLIRILKILKAINWIKIQISEVFLSRFCRHTT